ncbi:MAG: DUF971 domain-containing protein [Planctomycetes bacterium]|nr:DUF971 domain-containing protein [Planctomycetota bacterium]
MDPKQIDTDDQGRLRISWKDGQTTHYTPRQLRLACPCAQCVEEWTGAKLLDPDTVPENILLLETELVGRYALNFKWSDFHSTGIFSFDMLRRMAGLEP